MHIPKRPTWKVAIVSRGQRRTAPSRLRKAPPPQKFSSRGSALPCLLAVRSFIPASTNYLISSRMTGRPMRTSEASGPPRLTRVCRVFTIFVTEPPQMPFPLRTSRLFVPDTTIYQIIEATRGRRACHGRQQTIDGLSGNTYEIFALRRALCHPY